jgi:hypothetical protein
MDRANNRTYEEYTPVVEWSHYASFAKIIVPGKQSIKMIMSPYRCMQESAIT